MPSSTTTSLLRLTAFQRESIFRLRTKPVSSLPAHIRPLSQSTRLNYARKNAQDRESIDTEATEYSKSGTDDGAAKQTDAAYDSSVTDPAKTKEMAGEGTEGNPLEVSPANPDVSKQLNETEGGAEHSGKTENQKSGSGSPNKAGS